MLDGGAVGSGVLVAGARAPSRSRGPVRARGRTAACAARSRCFARGCRSSKPRSCSRGSPRISFAARTGARRSRAPRAARPDTSTRSCWPEKRSPRAPTRRSRPPRSRGSPPRRPGPRLRSCGAPDGDPIWRPRSARSDAAEAAVALGRPGRARLARLRSAGADRRRCRRQACGSGEPAFGVLQLVFKDDASRGASRRAHDVRAPGGARAPRERHVRGSRLSSSSGRARCSRSSSRRPRSSRSRTRLRPRSSESRSFSAPSASPSTCATTTGRLSAAAGRSGSQASTRSSPRGCSSCSLGAFAARGIVVVDDVVARARARERRGAAAEAGIEAAVALPLVVRGEVIGLLAVYPSPGRGADARTRRRCSLRSPRSSRSPSRTRACTSARSSSAASARRRSTPEREAARRVRALYEVSQSFAQSLSLEATLEALARRRASSCSTSTRRRSACPTSAASC